MVHFLWQVFIAFDQLVNALLLGYADETLSARAFRAHRDGKVFGKIFMPLIDALFFWQNTGPYKHCEWAYEAEKRNHQLPPEYRK